MRDGDKATEGTGTGTIKAGTGTGTGTARKATIVNAIQFDPNGDTLLVVRFSASLVSNKTAGEEEAESEGAPAVGNAPSVAPATGGHFEGGGNSGDVSIFGGGGGGSGDPVIFGGGGGDFTISIPVTVAKR